MWGRGGLLCPVALTPDVSAREIKMRELSKAEKENAKNAKDRKKAQSVGATVLNLRGMVERPALPASQPVPV